MDLSMIGENIRSMRKKKKWSQAKLAEEAGVSDKRTVSEWENGKIPKLENIQALSKALDCDPEYLLGTIEKPTNSLQFICDSTGLSVEAAKKILSWSDDLGSDSLDSRIWIRFLSEMLEDKNIDAFFERLHYGIIREQASQPVGSGPYSEMMLAESAAHHDATLYALSRIMSDITEKIMEGGMEDGKE